MARKTQQVETRMVSEWLHLTYPQYVTMSAVPLGKISDSLMAMEGYQKSIGISRPYRPEADYIVILPGALIVGEAKVWQVMNGIAKLPLYAGLVPVTPELQEYKNLPIVMELVVGWTNDNLQIMADQLKVRVRVYDPPWLDQVVQKMSNYWTADYRASRQKILEQRENLGLQ